MSLPHECAYELHHAVTHIAITYHNQDSATRKQNLRNACDHVRRAHLDYLKVLILHIHTLTRSGEAALNFHKDNIAARLIELDDIGGNHHATIQAFTKLIDDHYPSSLPDLEGCQYLPSYLEDNEVLRASNSRTTKYPSSMQGKLLWHWSCLEIVFISLVGERTYNISFELLDSYIKFEELTESLHEQISIFKILIIKHALEYDYNGELEKELKNVPRYDSFISRVNSLLQSPLNRKEALRELVAGSDILDKAFSVVKPFLGLPSEFPS
jgi:hypothetical protein